MIGFWMLAGLTAFVTVAILGYALIAHRGQAGTSAEFDMQVYRDQLKELERDVARGVLAEDEAERTKVEISRRLLEADRKQAAGDASGGAPRGLTWAALVLTGALVIGGGLWVYDDIGAPGYWDMPLETRFEAAATVRETRPDQAAAEAEMPDWAGPPPEAPQDYLDLVDQLRAAVAQHPDDLQGHSLLATHEAALGNYKAAYAAMSRVIELKGDGVTADDYSQYTDLLVLAAGGYVSPKAEEALDHALSLNPTDRVALYYAGLLNAQTGRPDVAFRIWRDLLEHSAPDDPWVAPIRSMIGELAALAGVDYTPPAPTMAGPTADDMAAAADMSPEDRAAMVDGMVTRLMDRLATEGGPASDWAQLITALGVQGNTERAAAIWGEARSVFAGHPDDLARIDAAAATAGLTEPTAPPAAPADGAALAGPSADDVAAAADMSAEDRDAMIDGMVTRLSDELATNGGPPAKWIQLINALKVLDEPERAASAWAEAQKYFADDPAGLAQVRAAAVAAGVAE